MSLRPHRSAPARLGFVVAVFALVSVLVGARAAFAGPPHPLPSSGPALTLPRRFPQAPPTPPPNTKGAGKIRLTTDAGERGPVVLEPRKIGFGGEVVVWNDGDGPLTVSRVAARTDDDDPRLPPHFTVRFTDGGGGSGVIQPHSSKRVTVTWVPDREPKVRQAVGHIVFTSTDERAGEVAMGVVATLGGPLSFLTAHLLTWLLFLPFAGALVAVAMRVVGYDVEKNVQRAPLVVASLEALFGLVLLVSFHGEVTRADGNDGFQFVERMTILPSLGIEYYVGVDGTSVSLVLIATLLGVVASFASYRAIVRDRASVLRQAAYYSGCQLLWGAAMGVFIAVDLALFAFFWALLVGALGLLIRELTRGDRAGPHPALTKLFAYGAVSVTCVVFAVVELHQHSNATFLGDGTRVAHSFALPELMRVGYNAKQLTLFGTAWVKVVYGALFVGFVVLVPSPPFHRWLVALFDDARAASAPAAMFVVGVVVNAGIYGLLRVSVDILPDASRWAATTLLVLGVVNVLTGAGLALVSKDIRHVVAYGVVAQAGFCLVGVGAMTREGFFGCLLQTSSRSLVAAVVAFFALGLYDSTPPEADVPTESRASKIAGFALLASVGVPGLSTFWGETVSVLGAFPSARLLAGAATFGGVVLAVAYVRAARSLLVLPTAVSASRKAKADLAMRDLLTLAPVVVFCVALGLFPAGLLRLVGGGVSDLNQLVNPPGPDEIL